MLKHHGIEINNTAEETLICHFGAWLLTRRGHPMFLTFATIVLIECILSLHALALRTNGQVGSVNHYRPCHTV